MISAAKKQKPAYEASASVVDGKLILSFPNARTPVVWQMDLSEVKASAMEVKGDKSPFTLTLRTTKGEALEVAPFDTKEEAVEALVAITKALQNAHGLIRPVSAGEGSGITAPPRTTPYVPAGKKRWGRLVLALLVLAGILYLFLSLQTAMPVQGDGSYDTAAPAPQNGVPMSADEFLNSNR